MARRKEATNGDVVVLDREEEADEEQDKTQLEQEEAVEAEERKARRL